MHDNAGHRVNRGSSPHTALRETPHEEYAARLAARRAALARAGARFAVISNVRLFVFVAGLALVWFVFGSPTLSPWWLLAPVAAFVALMVLHEDVHRARSRASRAARMYERDLARLEDRWVGIGSAGDRFLDPEHLYAADLDIFGQGSLFQLLSRARTRAGEETLASWLTEPTSPQTIRARQHAVAELGTNLDLREDLALLGDEVETGLHPRELAAWATAPPRLASRRLRWLALMLGALSLPALVGWIAFGLGPSPFVAILAFQIVLRMRLRDDLREMARSADRASTDLGLLAAVLRLFERATLESPLLNELRNLLASRGRPPSRWIRRLAIAVDAYEARRNGVFAPFSYIFLWDVHWAFAIESWRAAVGASVPRWLAAVGELEALSSLAGFHYERPGEVFPELVDGGPLFEAEAIGHPLLPDAQCVRNDVRLDGGPQLLVISGSNMSGKSTLLRTVGLCAALAQAGAPVRATRLRLSPLALGASIRVQDSIHAGVSRFYAEIQRLRRIVELTEQGRPVLFLIDEVLQGTNSHDRRIGVEAVMRTLVERGAMGLITTHDLALTAIGDALAPRAGNVHFEDRLEGGKMIFDYRLRPGVVTRSNALGLMRAVGLDV